jgi:hypothetical protein
MSAKASCCFVSVPRELGEYGFRKATFYAEDLAFGKGI